MNFDSKILFAFNFAFSTTSRQEKNKKFPMHIKCKRQIVFGSMHVGHRNVRHKSDEANRHRLFALLTTRDSRRAFRFVKREPLILEAARQL